MLAALVLGFQLITPAQATSAAHAPRVVCIDEITAKATPDEKAHISQLLNQIAFKEEKDPKTQQVTTRVIRVEKGSVYERNGVKVGDPITTSCVVHASEEKAHKH